MFYEILIGEGVKFERVRRVTGYLGDANHFNSAKQSEVRDRISHALSAPRNIVQKDSSI